LLYLVTQIRTTVKSTVGCRPGDVREWLPEVVQGSSRINDEIGLAKLMGVSLRGGKDVAKVEAHVATSDLEFLSDLITAGKVRPQIDRRFPFAEVPAAIAYLEQGHAKGKVVVEVS
jgi:NADPH:quinone reductase-like Zn-dependent oxidoreductase